MKEIPLKTDLPESEVISPVMILAKFILTVLISFIGAKHYLANHYLVETEGPQIIKHTFL